jgi:hypothetical protein
VPDAVDADTCQEEGIMPPCRFFGSFDWQAPSDMQFAFSRSRITAFQREVSSKQWTPEKQKVYSFFYVDDNIAAVRSSQGGYILMLKVSNFSDSD